MLVAVVSPLQQKHMMLLRYCELSRSILWLLLGISLSTIFHNSGEALASEITPGLRSQFTPLSDTELPANTPEPTEQTLPAPPELFTPRETLPQFDLLSPGDEVPLLQAEPSNLQFRVERVEVLGNTVLQDEIAALTSRIENQEVTFNDLLQLRADITQLYVSNGYITSGAFLPNNQVLGDGVVQIQVVEGSLEAIEINGLRRLQPGYVQSRVQLAIHPPLNQQRLEDSIRLLQLDPLLATVNAELSAGNRSGQNILILDLEEAPAFFATVSVDNYRPPSIGTLQGVTRLTHRNLTGLGDRISAGYSITEGLDLYDIDYTFPISPHGSTVGLSFNNSNSQIVQDVFEDLDIRSESESFSFEVQHPISRSPQHELALGLALDLRRSRSFLADRPFSFSVGPEAGRSNVTAIRFSQDWVQRYPQRVLAARSQFSLGINAFDATINDTGVDGEFFAWLGQVQWVEQMSPKVLLVSRLNAQLTPDALLPLERFSVGGSGTVRGYEENQIVADNGVTASVEALISLTETPNELLLTPFVEVGTAWNNSRDAASDPSTLASVGLGVRWLIDPSLQLRVDYGIPLISADDRSDSLQSNGLIFSLTFEPTTLLRTSD